MKSVIFKNLSDDKYNEKYSDEYVDYIIKNIIYSCNQSKCSLEYIKEELIKIYGDYLKESWVRKHLTCNYLKNGVNNYIISDEEKRIIKFINSLDTEISNNKSKNEEELYSELYRYVQGTNSMLIDVYACYIALRSLIDSIDKDVLLFKTYYMLEERFISLDKYEKKYLVLKNVDTIYDSFSIEYLVKERICINLLSIMNIDTVEQLKNTKKSMVDLIFTFDDSFYKMCELSKSLDLSLEELNNEFNKILNEREYEIIKLRYGYENGKLYTLEEIGSLNNVSRERIRQIEAKALVKIKKIGLKNKTVLSVLSNFLISKSKIIFDYDFDKYTKNKELSFKLNVLFQIMKDSKLYYNQDYKCFYNSDFKFDEIVSEILSEIPIYISEEASREYKGFKNLVFEKNYKKYSNAFIRKNLLLRDVYITLIKENFPNGFRASDENDYLKLKKLVQNIFGGFDDFPSIHSLNSMIERDDTMILCDRGKVISIENACSIPEDLNNRIIDYIYESKPSVYYNSIFDKFKYELKELGINNSCYLKGLIDRNLPKDFHTKRDYISIGESGICPYERIINMIHSFNGVFSLNDLKKDFNGVSDYVFFNILYSEKQNGLVFLDNKRFVYFNKLNISEKDINNLKKIIDELFISLNSDIISARKIYARIKLFEDKYDININMLTSYFDLFSIIQLLFPNDYYYSRPFISTNPNMALSNEELLRNHLINYDSFSNKDVKNYLTKMNVRGLYSYLMFMDSMSDCYVQVNIDKMIKKDLLNISEEELRNIKKVISLLLNNYDNIDTRTFKGYSIFPKLKYEWNKYLLVGIVRSYFGDIFSVENTTNTYNTTDFIIRRYNNE